MTIVQSLGTTLDLNMDLWPRTSASAGGSITLHDATTLSYARVYETQPNVRVCVDFIARNVAQLGLHVFRRKGDTDRERLTGHPLADMIEHPNPSTTRYQLIHALISDRLGYGNGYWRKLRNGGSRPLLVRVPPTYVVPKGGLLPEYYEVYTSGQREELAPSELFHSRLYNPSNTVAGLSPLATLKAIIAEEAAATDYREGLWKNGARHYGVIERPATAPEWGESERDRFRQSFEAAYSGKTGSGRALILEDGMTWKDAVFSAQEAQWLEGRMLTMEQAARMFHIPPPLVGILRFATYSNITEQHKMLYQDVLGPECVMTQEDIELQLLPDFEDTEGVYVEFNIQAKLAGSFDEQTRSLQAAVGAPYMTRNEARSRLNLPRLDQGGDEVVTPLNVTKGGQASPLDSGSQNRAEVVQRFVDRQARVLSSNGGKYDPRRWERELAEDLEVIGGQL